MSYEKTLEEIVEERIEEARRMQATHLDLEKLGLTQLPRSLSTLTELHSLNLSGNQLASLPPSIGCFLQLQELDISHNRLTALPENLGQLGQLRDLDASNNQLSALPESLGQLAQLQILIVWGNQLTALPQSLRQLTQLQRLDVSNNRLQALPGSLGQLKRLEVLSVWGNQLTGLPESMRKLRSLKQLFLHNNDGLGIPPEVLGPAWYDFDRGAPATDPIKILEYYFRWSGGQQPLNEAKLILIGRGGVGKTSLVNQLVHNRFAKDEKKTEGIQITDWELRLHDNEDVRLHIWDFGGQEIMHATHQFFLTQRALYLLVLNGREGGEDADAEYWLKLIESFGTGSPVIVVLNKVNEHPFSLNRGGLRQKYPDIRDFIRTDCEDCTGIAQLREAIERETDRLEYLRVGFPASRFAIKNRLANMPENYLTFDRYRQICAEYGETDAQGQEYLAFFLHILGIALNYKDDPRLRYTYVLNPHWAAL
jgi:internalin A